MHSVVGIVHAKRVWCGGTEPTSTAPTASADAVLIRDGLISYVGTSEEVLQRYRESERELPPSEQHRLIDCEGKGFVCPGFIDSHVHFLDGGRQLNAPALGDARNRAEFVETLRTFYENVYLPSSSAHKPSSWIIGGGWSEVVLGGDTPTREWLDEVTTTVPVVIFRKDIHTAVLNTFALECCHIVERSPDAAASPFQLPRDDDDDPILDRILGGVIERDVVTGAPNGVLRDNALSATRKYWPRVDTETNMRSALDRSTNYFLERGITTVFSMTSLLFSNLEEINFLALMEREGCLRVRVRTAVTPSEIDTFVQTVYQPIVEARNLAAATASGEELESIQRFSRPYAFDPVLPEAGGGYLHLGAVKFFSDGSLGSRTAAMEGPYIGSSVVEDSEGENAHKSKCFYCGMLTMPIEEMRDALRATRKHMLQCCVHAIGDRAVSTINMLYEEQSSASQAADKSDANAAISSNVDAFVENPRDRIEHCQHVGQVDDEVARMLRGRVIPSMQPCHLLFDGDYIDTLLGETRKNRSYLWRRFIHSGIRVAFGSDWPVAPADVLDGLRAAVTRVPDVLSHPAVALEHPVWTPSERLTMDEALRAFTYGGAYGAFLEDVTGTLEVGKWADLVILSDDLLDDSRKQKPTDASKVPWWPRGEEPQVLYTIVAGRIEFERAPSSE